MQQLKHILLVTIVFSFTLAMYVACGPSPTKDEVMTEKIADAGDTGGDKTAVEIPHQEESVVMPDASTEESIVTPDVAPQDEAQPEKDPVDAAPPAPITMTFAPASGAEIDVSGVCIKVTFSSAPSQRGWKIELMEDGASIATAAGFAFKDATTAEVCPFPILKQKIKYNLTVSVLGRVSAGQQAPTYTDTASYTTKAPYKDDKPADAGLAVNLKLKSIDSPSGLGDLISGVSPDQVPPILITLHSRDDGNDGNLTLVGGLGMPPPGGKPHQGNDVVDNVRNPVSLVLLGKFTGRAFYVGPTTFILSVAGYSLQLDNFSLTGVFSKDGKNIEEARLTGILDPEVVKQQLGFDVCLLLRDECFKGPDGKDRVLIAGKVEGIPNPIPFSAFIVTPLYLQTGFETKDKFEFYTTEEVNNTGVSFKLSTCTGSSDQQKPCDIGKGAKIAPVQDAGQITLDASKKHGFYTPEKLEANTWYKIELQATDSKQNTFPTFSIFQTK